MRQQGQELTLGPFMTSGEQRWVTAGAERQAQRASGPAKSSGGVSLSILGAFHSNRNRSPRAQGSKVEMEIRGESEQPPLLPPTSSPASLDQPRCGDHEVEEDVTAGLQADLHAVRQH